MRFAGRSLMLAVALIGISDAWMPVPANGGPPPANPKTETHVPAVDVDYIAELPDGTMAFGSSLGIVLWHNGSLQTFTVKTDEDDENAVPAKIEVGGELPGDVNCLLGGRDGSLWAGTSDGVVRIRHGKVEDVSPQLREALQTGGPAGPARSLESPDVMHLFEASDGRIVIGMRHGDLAIYDPDSDTCQRIPLAPTLELPNPPNENNWICHVAEDHEKRLWVCIMRLGAFRISEGQIVKLPADKNHWKSTDDVRCVFFDQRRNVWLGKESGLELHRPDGSSRLFTENDGLSENRVREIREAAPGELWIKTREFPDGLCMYDGKQFRYPVLGSSDYNVLDSLHKSRSGTYWMPFRGYVVGTPDVKWVTQSPFDRAVAVAQARVETEYPEVDADRTTATDGTGRIWIAVRNRLLRFDGKKWTLLPELLPHRPTKHPIISLKAVSRGRILACTEDGLFIFDGDQQSVIRGDNRRASYVFDVAEGPDGAFYIGAGDGLFSITGTQLELLTTDETFQATDVAVDKQGAVWFADPNEGLFQYAHGKVTKFTDRIPLLHYTVVDLEPSPAGGVRIRTSSTSLTGSTFMTFDFDGEEAVEIPEPVPVLGVEGQADRLGVKVDKVAPGSPAAKAKIAAGDVITEFEGQPITGMEELDAAVRQLKVGRSVTLGVIRRNETIKIKLRLKKWP